MSMGSGRVDAGDPRLACHWLGRVEYRRAWELQLRLAEAVREGARPASLLLLEHPHVFTMGRAGREENLLWDASQRRARGVDLVWSDRGGDATYHGPGQLVGYPIVDLRRWGLDGLAYLRALEASLVSFLSALGVAAEAGDRDAIGIWAGSDKVAAIGVKVSGGVTRHGFALNLQTCLDFFQGIVPCGLADRGVTSVERLIGSRIGVEAGARAYAPHLAQALGMELGWPAGDPLERGSSEPPAFSLVTG